MSEIGRRKSDVRNQKTEVGRKKPGNLTVGASIARLTLEEIT